MFRGFAALVGDDAFRRGLAQDGACAAARFFARGEFAALFCRAHSGVIPADSNNTINIAHGEGV